ncbi:MAG: diguanylate cyclase [Arenicellales bacterium]|nr:diguanylate cyclase [Arenicellales bacterium]
MNTSSTNLLSQLQSENLGDVIAYGDLNCPFCFALHQRLADWGLLERIEWRLIVHAPELSKSNFSLEDQSLLANEVFSIHHRAPDVTVKLPRTRPGTEMATELIYALGKASPTSQATLRLALYQSLWLEGRNIADPTVLQEIINEAGLADILYQDSDDRTVFGIRQKDKNGAETIDVEPLPVWQFLQEQKSAPTEFAKWQSAWESNEHFDRRIPIMTHRTNNNLLLGLPTEEALYQFLLGRRAHFVNHEVCVFQPRPVVALYGSMENLWPAVRIARESCEVLHFSDLEQCQETLVQNDNVDFLIIEHEFVEDIILDALTNLATNRRVTWVLASLISSDAAEIRALKNGATEYMPLDRSPEILNARFDKLVTDRRDTTAISEHARIDSLTQVSNRRDFQFRIEQEWQRLVDRGSGNCSLLLIDIDFFKPYNDTYGHLAGDACLKKVATVLSNNVKEPTSLVARYGGEEFVALLPETNLSHASAVGERLRQAVASEEIAHTAGTDQHIVTISVGVASATPVTGGTAGDLIHIADDHLYLAKGAGRNQVCSQGSRWGEVN